MAAGAGNSFPAALRLRRPAEFRRARAAGRKGSTTYFITYMVPGRVDWNRLGVTVSRKVGNAVVRNRVKRLVREFFRLHRQFISGPVDLSIIAKPGAGNLSYRQVCQELSFICQPVGKGGPCTPESSFS